MAQIYLAGPFFSDEQIQRIQDVEEALTKNPTIRDFYSPRLNQTTENPEYSAKWAAEIFMRDVTQVQQADLIVAIIDYRDDDADSGTAFEIGMAWTLNKPIIVINELNFKVNLMLSESLHAYLTRADQLADYDFNTLPKLPFTGELF